MKTVFDIRLVLVACALGMMVRGGAKEVPEEIGFVRFVNAVAPGKGMVKVRIDGEELFPTGYRLGQRTGGIGLKAGGHSVAVRKDGVEPGKTRITLEDGGTLTLIAFAEKLPGVGEGDPPQWGMRILRLKQSDAERGFRLTFVSVCGKNEVKVTAEIKAKGSVETAEVKRLQTTFVDIGKSRSEVLIRMGDRVLTTVSPDDRGNYVVVLYEDENGECRALSFYDPKFVIAK